MHGVELPEEVSERRGSRHAMSSEAIEVGPQGRDAGQAPSPSVFTRDLERQLVHRVREPGDRRFGTRCPQAAMHADHLRVAIERTVDDDIWMSQSRTCDDDLRPDEVDVFESIIPRCCSAGECRVVSRPEQRRARSECR
jgi:hypothetical protein